MSILMLSLALYNLNKKFNVLNFSVNEGTLLVSELYVSKAHKLKTSCEL